MTGAHTGQLAVALEVLAARLIDAMTRDDRGVVEGVVMSQAAPYRRLDCDHRALAYVRARPRKGVVRIDVSGLWRGDPDNPRHKDAAGAAAVLEIRTGADVEPVADYLRKTIDRTRAANAAAAKRGAR